MNERKTLFEEFNYPQLFSAKRFGITSQLEAQKQQ